MALEMPKSRPSPSQRRLEIVGQEDVVGLEIAVDNAKAMGGIQAVRDLLDQHGGSRRREPTFLRQDPAEAGPGTNSIARYGIPASVSPASYTWTTCGLLIRDAFMPSRRNRRRASRSAVGERGAQELHRRGPLEADVLCPVHLTHTAGADELRKKVPLGHQGTRDLVAASVLNEGRSDRWDRRGCPRRTWRRRWGRSLKES